MPLCGNCASTGRSPLWTRRGTARLQRHVAAPLSPSAVAGPSQARRKRGISEVGATMRPSATPDTRPRTRRHHQCKRWSSQGATTAALAPCRCCSARPAATSGRGGLLGSAGAGTADEYLVPSTLDDFELSDWKPDDAGVALAIKNRAVVGRRPPGDGHRPSQAAAADRGAEEVSANNSPGSLTAR